MGFIKRTFKKITKSLKNLVAAPFEAVRDVSRGVKALTQGDIGGALGNVASAGLNVGSFGTISEGGTLIDTKVKEEGNDMPTLDRETPIVSFLDTSVPSLVLGSDATDEIKKKKTSANNAGSFLGGVGSSSSLLV